MGIPPCPSPSPESAATTLSFNCTETISLSILRLAEPPAQVNIKQKNVFTSNNITPEIRVDF
jgi:hypothetical protein